MIHRYILLTTVIVTLVALGALLIFWYLKQQLPTEEVLTSETDIMIEDAVSAREKGNPDRVVSTLEPLLKSGNESERATAVRLTAESLYAKDSIQSKIQATDMLKSFIADQTISTPQRARSADLLFALYSSDEPDEVFEVIFTGEPYGLLRESDGRKKDLVRNAVELMWNEYPTSGAALRLAFWYSSELLDNKDLDDIQREEYSIKIEDYLQEAERLYTMRSNPNAPFTINDASFYSDIALLYGILAINDAEHRTKFESAYENLLSEMRNRGEDQTIQKELPFVLFYNAALLDAIYGDTRESGVHSIIADLVDEMDYATDDAFLGFIQREARTDEESRDFNYYFLVRLAEISPEFRNILSQNGFTF